MATPIWSSRKPALLELGDGLVGMAAVLEDADDGGALLGSGHGARGKPGPFTPVDLAVQCGRPLLLRQPFAPDAFDQVILGCVNVIADEMNPARVAALRLGMGEAMTAFTVQINCGSGMQSIDTAYRYIQEGISDLILAGGAEVAEPCAAGVQPQRGGLVRAALRRARSWSKLTALLGFRPSLLHAGDRARARPHRSDRRPQHGPDRRDRRRICSTSRGGRPTNTPPKASSGWRARRTKDGFEGEVEPAFARDGTLYDHDDGVRPDSTRREPRQAQARLRAALGQGDAGQQLADHRRRVVGDPRLGRRGEEAQAASRSAVIVDSEWSALDPSIMGLGPVLCSTALLRRHQLALGDIELWELNEAFAAQVLGCLAAWEDDEFCRDVLGLDGAAGAHRARQAQRRRRRDRRSAIRSARAATASCCISSTP